MIEFNIELCHSVKSKNAKNTQCCNKKKDNENLCGKHLNAKEIILYSDYFKLFSESFTKNLVIITEHNDEIIENENKDIYSKDILFEKIFNNEYISIYSLRNSIKFNGLKKLINTKQSKSLILKDLKNFHKKERYYVANIKNVILIQSIYRRWNIYRRALCVNDTDILTFTSKYDIEDKYLYIFKNDIGKKYAYDIRTLYQIVKSQYPSCPYTFKSFTDNEINNILSYCQKLDFSIVDEKEKMTIEEETIMKMKDVFYEINMLDNYTDYRWFEQLNVNQLISLYIKTEDIWNYRSLMTKDSKEKIVNSGVVFNLPIFYIKSLKNKTVLQNIILDEYRRMITEGINREEKKLGAILILTGLVEVSVNANMALPHLVQM